MKKYIWIIIVAVIGMAVAGWFIFKNSPSAAVEWKTAKVEKGDITVTVTATGTLNAVTTVQVGTQVSGIIDRILVDFNSVVKEGQVIALLDTTYLAAALEDASATVERNQIQVNQTKRDYDRMKILFDEKVVAQADYDAALSAYETAVSNVRSARANLNRANINLKYATITAPISGVIVSRNVDVGQTVAASFNTPTLFTIANDLTKMQVQASIDEADIGKILVGQAVTFTVDAYDDQTFSGTVRQVRLQPTVLQNVVNYTVIIDVPNPDMKLLPGMTANITVTISEIKDILKVPSAALRFNPAQEYLAQIESTIPDSLKKKREQWKQRQGQGMGQGMGSGQGMGREHNNHGPGAEGQRGTMWVFEGGNLKPMRVRIGLTDGSFTQVEGKVTEGMEVVTGQSNQSAAKTQTQQQNPFAPQMPGGRR
jgi:HlyD family secretion protein